MTALEVDKFRFLNHRSSAITTKITRKPVMSEYMRRIVMKTLIYPRRGITDRGHTLIQ